MSSTRTGRFVAYECNGRFGNNIIQYLAAYCFAKKIGATLVPLHSTLLLSTPYKLTDDEWVHIMLDQRTVGTHPYILLNQYYQRGDVFMKYKDWVLEALAQDWVFNGLLNIRDIKQPVIIPEDTAVVHLRLDDYNFQASSNVVDPRFYIDEIRQSNKPKILLVVDKLRYPQEHKYITMILSPFQDKHITIQQGSVLEDWNLLRMAPYVISSNSSFAWIACFLGKLEDDVAKTVIYPDTKFYDKQNFSLEGWAGWKSITVPRKDFTTL